MSLADFLNEMEAQDEEMSKQAAELEKLAAEEEAAGRIMARGFMDELNKLAQDQKPMKFKPMEIRRSEKSLMELPKHKAKAPPAGKVEKTAPAFPAAGVKGPAPLRAIKPRG